MPGPFLQFDTTRLQIRPSHESDASFLLELLNSSPWLRHIGDRHVHTIEEAREYIATKMTSQLNSLGYSNYTLFRKLDGVRIGICGLYAREGSSTIEIGYALLPAYFGMGFASEAAQRLMQAAKEDFGITSLRAVTGVSNSASQRLLQKLGMTLLERVQLPNEMEEVFIFQILF